MKNDHHIFKKAQVTFKLKHHFTCNSFNFIYVVICDKCEEEYIEETGDGKTKLKDIVRVCWEHIRQRQYQQLKVQGHVRVCGNGEFGIFPMLQMRSQNINLRQKFKAVYGTTTDEWHTADIQVHTSDIRVTYEYIRVTYGWHTNTYEWHMDDIRVHTSIYEWHTSIYR